MYAPFLLYEIRVHVKRTHLSFPLQEIFKQDTIVMQIAQNTIEWFFMNASWAVWGFVYKMIFPNGNPAGTTTASPPASDNPSTVATATTVSPVKSAEGSEKRRTMKANWR
jgi:hypothetical protein